MAQQHHPTTTPPTPRPFQIGDRVRIRFTEWRGRIVELRGPLGSGGAHLYRVRYRGNPRPAYAEATADELILLESVEEYLARKTLTNGTPTDGGGDE